MKVFVCTNFEGRWISLCSAIVVAENSETAKKMLLEQLQNDELHQSHPEDISLREICTDAEYVEIMCDGDY